MFNNCVIKNINTTDEHVLGVVLSPGQEYNIPSTKRISASQDDSIFQRVSSGDLQIGNGTSFFSNAAEQLTYLVKVVENVHSASYAFAEKVTYEGKQLFRRKLGVSNTINAGQSGTLSLVVPYAAVKINKIEIINGAIGDAVDLKVYDTPTGTISGVPNYMLNQFGTSVYVSEGFYVDESKYDADLIQNMKIELNYYNNGASNRTIYMNVVLHELV